MTMNHLDGFLGKPWENIFQLQPRSNASLPPEGTLNGRPAFGLIGINMTGGRYDDAILPDIEIRRDIRRGTDAEIVIKTSIDGPPCLLYTSPSPRDS